MTPTQATQINLVSLTIDGKPVAVPKGTTVYTAAKQLGIDIPIFCYHDRMPPFGACRMCLVEVEKHPKLATSCTLEAAEGMVVKTQSAAALKGREGILEFLLVNHPLDCPICDRGGECPLQDNALKHGPGQSRFYEEKRHFEKRLPLGPVLVLDRERCIVCARCTRFGELIAGDHALEFIDRGFKTEVGTPGGGPAESKFIGNTIMICPVGALTSQVYRFRARPWDNDATESVCPLCPVGCNLILDSRDGEIMRTRSLENREVNDIWLCDKGWFGYEFAGHLDRLKQPLIRRNGRLEPARWEETLDLIAAKFKEAKPSGKLGALGGNPLTVEENYLFQKLFREAGGVGNVDHRVGMPVQSLEEEGIPAGMEMAIGDCEEVGFAVLLGVDLTEEFPVIWLRLRQAINKGATVIFLGHQAPEIARYLTRTVLHAPGQELSILKEHLPHVAAMAQKGKPGAIFVGGQYLATKHRRAILAELLRFRQETPQVALNIMDGRGNSMGARLAGMHSELLPLGKKAPKPGLNATKMIETAAREGWKFLYVAGGDPASKFPAKLWKEARRKTDFLVVQDLFLTETAKQADVVLPTLCFAEKGGRLVNIEGRAQTLNPGKAIPEGVLSDGEIFTLLGQKLGNDLKLDAGFQEKIKPGRLQIERPEKIEGAPVSTAGARDGEFLLSLSPKLFDHGIRLRHCKQTSQLAKEPSLKINRQEGTKKGLKSNDKIRVSSAEGSFAAKVILTDDVAAGTLVAPLGFPELPVHELGVNLLNGLAVQVKKE